MVQLKLQLQATCFKLHRFTLHSLLHRMTKFLSAPTFSTWDDPLEECRHHRWDSRRVMVLHERQASPTKGVRSPAVERSLLPVSAQLGFASQGSTESCRQPNLCLSPLAANSCPNNLLQYRTLSCGDALSSENGARTQPIPQHTEKKVCSSAVP